MKPLCGSALTTAITVSAHVFKDYDDVAQDAAVVVLGCCQWFGNALCKADAGDSVLLGFDHLFGFVLSLPVASIIISMLREDFLSMSVMRVLRVFLALCSSVKTQSP
ncbi:hypothetical protein AF72_00055 [Xylella taiwanensis]|uniref:Uncharacterized protein n=1 Tax=Xylella taiwanensis TaxID=1444770 RepID=Z9JNN8_9GAMM|nr:hypothetical protein AF72_00055 [Xylella taiwanensis]